MQLIEVTNKREEKLFLDVVKLIYKDCPEYIRPLDISIENIFNENNIFYRNDHSKRWILLNNKGQVIGRIAAFINEAINNGKKTLAFGFFECIDSQEAANILFNKVIDFASTINAEIIEGPVNYGPTHAFWGLLTEGFDKSPSFEVTYNPKYYINLFDSFGFKVKYHQFTKMHYLDSDNLPDRVNRIADRVRAKEGFSIKTFNINQFTQFAKYAVDIYNDAWKDNVNFIPATIETFLRVFKNIKQILDEKLILFAFYNGEPISLLVCIPDPNAIMKDFNGKLNFINKIRFILKKNLISKVRVLALAHKSKYKNRGFEAVLFQTLSNYLNSSKKYKELEISWVGSYNGVMLSILNSLNGINAKQHTVYIKEI
ncbi:MAG: GNAT family N-acetyltransferase [Solitalea-like symbiont of Tyrophagus putrescentiae]